MFLFPNEYKNIIDFLGSRRKNKDRRKEAEFYEDDDLSDERPSKRRRPTNNEYKRLRKPSKDVDEDYKLHDNGKEQFERTKERPIIKPLSGTIYDKPRVAPKIKLPVPKNEAEKYAYKPLTNTKVQSTEVTKDYDDYDYEEILPRKRPKEKHKKRLPIVEKTSENLETTTSSTTEKTSSSIKDDIESYDEYDLAYDEKDEDNSMKDDFKEENTYISKSTTTSKPTSITVSTTSATTTTTTSKTTTTLTTTKAPTPASTSPTTEIYIGRLNEPLIRLVKRPFLPSRGGNPYTPRGLQPVGARALNSALQLTVVELNNKDYYNQSAESQKGNVNNQRNTGTREEVFNLPPKLINTPQQPVSIDQNYYAELNQNYQQRPVYVQNYPNRIPIENEYDTTLGNESRSPIVANNVQVRYQSPGYSEPRDSYNTLQQTKFNPNTQITPTNYKIVFQNTPQRQQYQIIPQTNVREQFVHSSADFKGQQYSVINPNDRPRQVQNTQAYYARY